MTPTPVDPPKFLSSLAPTEKQWIERGVWLVLLVLAFFTGRMTTPAKVKIHETVTEKVKVEYVTNTEYRDRVVEKLVYVKSKAVETVVYRDIVTTVTDAGVVTLDHSIETTREKTDEASVADKDTSKALTASTSLVAEGDRTHEKTVEVTYQPDWHLTLLVGGQLSTPFVPIAGPLVLGAAGEHHLLGPIYAGLWLHTGGSAGLSVSGAF